MITLTIACYFYCNCVYVLLQRFLISLAQLVIGLSKDYDFSCIAYSLSGNFSCNGFEMSLAMVYDYLATV